MNKALFAGAIVIGLVCAVLGVPIDFVLFGLTLVGVALFHHHTLQVALSGLAVIALYKLLVGWHPTDKRGRALLSAPPIAEEVLPSGA